MPPASIPSSGSVPRRSERPSDAWRAAAVCGFLVLVVLLVFSRTLYQGFLNWDDGFFVYDEPHVAGGLSWSGISWAFITGPGGEWYPLSMLSHMLDCQLFGLRPAGHHLSNVLLHAASAVMLFLVLWRMTGALWPSALVAALFALHPLRVESVAWVSERRDVLSGLFFMLTLGAYGEYVRHPRSLGRYLATVGLFGLGLMAKPMLVTLPPLLVLLDFWPLGRFGGTQPDRGGRYGWPAPYPRRIVLDKLPLLAMAICVMVLATRFHSTGGLVALPERFGNAAVSCVAYIGQLFVPVGLSAFYPFPEAGRPVWQVAAASALLLAITTAAVFWRRSYPYFFVGWFWYLGMLIPVLELIPAGAHSRADRYTYLPQIGLFIVLVWGAMRLGAAWPARRWVFGIGSALALAVLMVCTWRQTGYWQDDQTLWEHAVACDPKNARAHYLLGVACLEKDERAAEAEFRQALELGPHERNIYSGIRAQAHTDLGNAAAHKGDTADAMAHYHQAIESYALFAPPHMNLGILLATKGDFDAAKLEFERAVELAPLDAALARCNLGIALAQYGKTEEAIASYQRALEADPDFRVARVNLGNLLAERGDVDEAIVHFRRAIDIDPDIAMPYQRLAQLLRGQGKTNEARKYEAGATKANRRFAKTQTFRGTQLIERGKTLQAIAQFQTAIAAAPDDLQAQCNLAEALALQGNPDQAIAHYRRALEIDPNFAPARQKLQQLSSR
jgi:tetratricopeptide (TPR) repeat protein